MPRPTISCIAIIAVGACLGVTACGSSEKDTVVIRVGSHAITRGTIDHWVKVEAVTSHEAKPTKAIPKGLIPVPPDYTDCIALLEKEAEAGIPTRAQMKSQCTAKYKMLKEQILEILITYYWVASESAEKGVMVSGPEVARYLRKLFPTDADYQRFLRVTGESAADEQMLAKRVLFGEKLLALTVRSARTATERDRAIIEYATELSAKWTPQTSCRTGYVVLQCRQHGGPQG